MNVLEGKVVLVTGGSRGIGEAIVRNMAQNGATVVFTYRSSAESSEKIANELRADGCTVDYLQSDASDYAACEQLVSTVMEKHGRIDVLVNNAGITQDNLMLRMSEEQWDKVIEVNLKSVFNLTKHILKPMMRQRAGSIINISSVVGVFGNAGQANYAASKAGIIGFTKSIAKEVGSRNIRCNAIAPGFIETEMTDQLNEKVVEEYYKNIPLKRFGSTKEISDAVTFLASDMSSYITGQVLSVCGGLNV